MSTAASFQIRATDRPCCGAGVQFASAEVEARLATTVTGGGDAIRTTRFAVTSPRKLAPPHGYRTVSDRTEVAAPSPKWTRWSSDER